MPSSRQRNYTSIQVQNIEIKLSNLNKLFYEQTGTTKAEVIDYYIRISPALLPHLADRPLTLKRYPDGAGGKFFYQKECPVHRPCWVKTVPVWSGKNQRHIKFCLIQDLPTLIWAVNLAALELHTSLSRSLDISTPTMLVFDLDPGSPATILDCAQVSLWIRDVLACYNLASFPKTSGSKGLQVYIPLNSSSGYGNTKSFARTLAKLLEKRHPNQVVSNMRKALRIGKVFIDWSQNDAHKTTVCVYSLRAVHQPNVSTPITWEEVENAVYRRDPSLLTFTTQQVLERVKNLGDLFEPVLSLQQTLPSLQHLPTK